MLMHSIYNPSPADPTPPYNARAAVVKQTPLPFEQWPAFAKAFSLAKIDGEKGVGDTAHRLFNAPVARQISDVVFLGLKLFKTGCGCVRRQAEWNGIYPYLSD